MLEERVEPDVDYRVGYTQEFIERVRRKRAKERKESVVAHIPPWARKIVIETCDKHGVPAFMIMHRDRFPAVTACRNEIQYLLRAYPTHTGGEPTSFPDIGKWLRRNHTSVVWSVAKHAHENGLPPLTTVDYETNRLIKAERHRSMKRAA